MFSRDNVGHTLIPLATQKVLARIGMVITALIAVSGAIASFIGDSELGALLALTTIIVGAIAYLAPNEEVWKKSVRKRS
jgi:hypothetical protein